MGNMSTNKILSDHFSDQHNQRDVAITCQVNVYPSELTEQLANLMSEELERLASNEVIRKEAIELGKETLLKYFKMLVYLRVARVRHTLHGNFSSYQRIYNDLCIPSILQLVLAGIGEVRDEDYNIVFKPIMNIDEEDVLSAEEMIQISEFLRRFQTLATVIGLPKAEDGELEFMTMRKVQDVIRSYKTESHPVHAFLSAFCEMTEMDNLLSGLLRVTYRSISEYKQDNLLVWNRVQD